MSEDDFQFRIDFSEPKKNSFTVLTQWMDRQHINAFALPPNILQDLDSESFHYRETQQRELHDWTSLVMDIQLVVTSSQDDAICASQQRFAIAIARELRDRYPNMSLAEIGQAIRAVRLWRDGGYLLAESAYQARSTVALINRMRTPIGEPKGIGNTNCKYNACSEYLRCAVNPCGPCKGCNHFEAEERDRDD